jgi:hypothetical protein
MKEGGLLTIRLPRLQLSELQGELDEAKPRGPKLLAATTP